MATKDKLVEELEASRIKWDKGDAALRMELIRPFVNSQGMITFPKLSFDRLPEVLQMMVSLLNMDNEILDNLAVKEGYLDLETRILLHRNTVIAAVAGSINRGSTATESSAYHRTGNTRWSKRED